MASSLFCSSTFYLLIITIYSLYIYCNIEPRVNWKISSQFDFEKCKDQNLPVVLMFGATSMLGRHVVDTFKTQQDICLVSFARSNCPKCDINIKGDLRDIRLIERVIASYKPETVIGSVKPPLMGIHYKEFIELNLFSMVQLIDASKAGGVKNFIYVSSIAAAGHYFDHYNAKESDTKPYYTDFEVPYDVSKRFTEDYLLERSDDNFRAVALRVGGIMGGSDDPYFHLRWPFLIHIDIDAPVDANYAGNIAEALSVVYSKMSSIQPGKKCSFCHDFYYFTGTPLSEAQKAEIVSKATGKPMIPIPGLLFRYFVKVMYWAKIDPNMYSEVDLYRMGLIPQTFDQTKFHKTFPEFKEVKSLAKALFDMYSPQTSKSKDDL